MADDNITIYGSDDFGEFYEVILEDQLNNWQNEFLQGEGDFVRLTIFSKIPGITTPTIQYYSELNSNRNFDGEYVFWSGDYIYGEFPITGISELNCLETIGNEIGSSTIHVPENPKCPQIFIDREASDGQIYLKFSEIFQTNYIPTGNYRVQIDFFTNFWHNLGSIEYDGVYQIAGGIPATTVFDNASDPASPLYSEPRFLVQEISPSRKEIRLIARYGAAEGDNFTLPFDTIFQNNFQNLLGTNTEDDGYPDYEFNYFLNTGFGEDVPVVNYIFDSVSNPNANETTGTNVSLILKFNESVPQNITNLSPVSISKRLAQTQTQDIIYTSNITTTVVTDELAPDDDFDNNTQNTTQDDNYQNYNQLVSSASISENISDILDYEINTEDQNLDINFNYFKNHTFFGSALEKVKNFKAKVETIQAHYSEISSSLIFTGSFINSRREELFKNIRNQIQKFTPYERFLYYDNQSQTTASVPGLGPNLAKPVPIKNDLNQLSNLIRYDGFNTVYKHSSPNSTDDSSSLPSVNLFTDMYNVEDAPFHNYSGSLYLSFLVKASGSLDHRFVLKNTNEYHNNIAGGPPTKAYGGGFTLSSSLHETKYRRFIIEASQSYWRPSGSSAGAGALDTSRRGNIKLITDNGAWADNNYWEILKTNKEIFSASMDTGSYPIFDDSGQYGELLNPVIRNDQFHIMTHVPRTGSILPSGELFNLYWTPHAAVSMSFITDIKITTKNPKNALPFSTIYATGSADFRNWYDGLYSSASAYDDDNIHSLVNNLPEHYKIANDSADLKRFLNMLGEHFDLIKAYIDNYLSFNKKGYKKSNSVPDNLLPILGQSLGWDFINPYSSSLSEYFSGIDNSEKGSKEITNSTWRKVFNNLIYIYKSKGTRNSLRALLNSYGYPPDLLDIQEYGDSIVSQDDTLGLGGEGATLYMGMSNTPGGASWETQLVDFSLLDLGRSSKELNLDWNTNLANDIDSFSFVLSSPNTTNTQTLLESSGSSGETLFKLDLIPSASDPKQAQLRFYLNNSKTGSKAIASNAVSMSTSYLPINNNELWNVMIKRVKPDITGSGTQKYNLITGMLDGDRIRYYSEVSMSVSGAMTGSSAVNADSNYHANTNWFLTGSLNNSKAFSASAHTSGNLVVGRAFSGSIAEIQAWTQPLSTSLFRKRILNKKLFEGNELGDSTSKLVYHFKLNETNLSGSNKSLITDASSVTKDYSRYVKFNNTISTKRFIDLYKLAPINAGVNRNDNKINIDSPLVNVDYAGLDPRLSSVRYQHDERVNQRRNILDVNFIRSATKKLESYLLNIIGNKSITGKYGDPQDQYEDSYSDLDSFREELYQGVKININKFIDAQSQLFNPDLMDSVKKTLPARSNFNNIGVEIHPTVIERNKVKRHRVEIKKGSGAGFYESNFVDVTDSLVSGSYSEVSPYISTLNIPSSLVATGSYLSKYISDNIDIDSLIEKSAEYSNYINNISLNISPDISSSLGRDYKTLLGTINLAPPPIISSSLERDYNSLFGTINLAPPPIISSSIDDYSKVLVGTLNFTPPPILSGSLDGYSYNKAFVGTLNFTPPPILSGSLDKYTTALFGTINLTPPPVITGSRLESTSTTNLTPSPKLSGSLDKYVTSLIGTIDFLPPPTISASYYDNIVIGELLMTPPPMVSASLQSDYKNLNTTIKFTNDSLSVVGENLSPYGNNNRNTEIRDRLGYESRLPWEDGFGNNVFILSAGDIKSGSTTRASGSGFIDRRYVFYTIGDNEMLSGSVNSASGLFEYDYSKLDTFKGRKFVDKGKGFEYKPLRVDGHGVDFDKYIDERPIGRTAYFVTASSNLDKETKKGDIVYPSNHYINFPTTKEQGGIRHLFYEGTLNQVSDYKFEFDVVENDLWLKPAYTVNVGGTDTKYILKVERPNE